jgi:hypothetical protein
MSVIVGAVVGGLGAFGLCVAFILFRRRWRASVPVILPINAPQHAEPGVVIGRGTLAVRELTPYPLMSALPATSKARPGVYSSLKFKMRVRN